MGEAIDDAGHVDRGEFAVVVPLEGGLPLRGRLLRRGLSSFLLEGTIGRHIRMSGFRDISGQGGRHYPGTGVVVVYGNNPAQACRALQVLMRWWMKW